MAASPITNSEGPLTVTVTSNGSPLADSAAGSLVSVTVTRAVNAIPYARIVISDGDMATQEFPISDSVQLVPGAVIVISAGYANTTTPIFTGVVMRHGLKISGKNYSRLVIECRDKATALTVGRKNANYIDKKDSDIIETLFSAVSVPATATATDVVHKEIVQYYCTDWDFALSRADANGMLVIVTDGKAKVAPPDASASPVLSVTYGMDLIEFEADIDARTQLASAQAVAWDPSSQTALQGSSAAPVALNEQGNLTQATLASVLNIGTYRMQTAAPLAAGELRSWAQAQQVKAGLARIRGRMKFQGSSLAAVGSLITVAGVGERFNGDVFVSAVHHELAHGNWFTDVEFGMSTQWLTQRDDVVTPSASGLVPGVEGLQIGVVMKLDGDPEAQQRIQVSTPVMQPQTDGIWARLAKFAGSSGFGAFFVPEIGDEVVLGYLNNDPACPVILGNLYSSSRKPAYTIEAPNNIKAIVTRSMHKLEFDEEKKIITMTTPGTNKMILSDDGKSIQLLDQNGNKVELTPSGISLTSPKDINITATGAINIKATQNVSISSSMDVKTEGLNIASTAQVGFTAKGTATAELSATGQTTVKGALVMIN